MTISKRLRFEVLSRDRFTCRYCGRPSQGGELHVDHVVPVTLGGTDALDNLVAACIDCNSGKSSTRVDMSPQDISASTAWRDAIAAAAAEEFLVPLELLVRGVEAVDEAWTRWHIGESGPPCPRPDDWARTVRIWVGRGMPVDVLAESVQKAMETDKVRIDDKWRYFCGIVWKKLTTLEERARQILAEQYSEDFDASHAEGMRENIEGIL